MLNFRRALCLGELWCDFMLDVTPHGSVPVSLPKCPWSRKMEVGPKEILHLTQIVCSSAIQNWKWDLQFCRPMIFFADKNTISWNWPSARRLRIWKMAMSQEYIDPPNWLEPVNMTKIVVVLHIANLLSFPIETKLLCRQFFVSGVGIHFSLVAWYLYANGTHHS